MKRVSVASVVLLFVCALSSSVAKPLTDFSELDRTVPPELKKLVALRYRITQ